MEEESCFTRDISANASGDERSKGERGECIGPLSPTLTKKWWLMEVLEKICEGEEGNKEVERSG